VYAFVLANVFVVSTLCFSAWEVLMGHKNRQNTVLDARSEEVQQSAKRGISRRKFVQTSAGVVAAGALLGKRAFAANGPIKIGYVTPQTGGLAPFGEADTFVFEEIRKYVQGASRSAGLLALSKS
jgi:hypothetical protein